MAAAKLVRSGSVAADIGTDHGRLICHLIASGNCPRGFACDIAEKPLNAAKQEIGRQGLSDKIEVMLTDGLFGLENRGIQDIIILGMGGDLIGEIITNAPWIKSDEFRLVLQPMTKAERLRRLLYREGFAILQETAVISGRFVYSVMQAAYTGNTQDIGDELAWGGLIKPTTDANREYLRRTANKIKSRADGLALTKGREKEAADYYDLAKNILEV